MNMRYTHVQVENVKKGFPYIMFGDGHLASCKPISEADLASFMADCIEDKQKINHVLPIGGASVLGALHTKGPVGDACPFAMAVQLGRLPFCMGLLFPVMCYSGDMASPLPTSHCCQSLHARCCIGFCDIGRLFEINFLQRTQ